MTRVKICGITTEEDAVLACELGASLLGMIFVASSPRHIQMEEAKRISARLKGKIDLVGVFQNEESSKVNYIAEDLDLDFVQLHGNEQPDYCGEIDRELIKVVVLHFPGDELEPKSKERRYEDVALVSELQRYPFNVRHFLFDKPKSAERNGWLENAVVRLERIQQDCRLPKYFFAGGLNSLNVANVIERLLPYGVDVASGVEARPGVKDKRMLAEFLEAAGVTGFEAQEHVEQHAQY